MKNLLLVIWIILGMASVASAAPFLWSDTNQYPPSMQPLTFQCKFDAGNYIPAGSEINASGYIYIHHDLASMGNGSHTVVCQACSSWGCSVDSLPFVFVKQVPNPPQSFTIK